MFIIGATGGVGSRLAAQLIKRGDQPIGLHRRPEQAPLLQARGIEPVAGDLTSISVEDLAARAEGTDAIVFTAARARPAPGQRTRSTGRVWWSRLLQLRRPGSRGSISCQPSRTHGVIGACRRSSNTK